MKEDIVMKKVTCFGAGSFLEKCFTMIRKVYDIIYIYDNDSKKWGTEFICNGVATGITIVSPEKYITKREEEIIYITSSYADKISIQLNKMCVGGGNKYYVIYGGVDNICYNHQNMLWKYIQNSIKSMINDIERYPFDFKTYMKSVYREWSNIFFAANKVLLPNLQKESKILDYGFGCGTLVLNWLLLGYNAYGVDVDIEKYMYVMQLIDDLCLPSEWKKHFILYDGIEMCFNDNEFDFVFCDYVLEHVANCRKSVKEMLRVCKREGYLQLNCPNYDASYEEHFFLDLGKPLRGNKKEFCKLVKQMGGNEEYVHTLNFINTQDVYDMLGESGYQMEITNCKDIDELKGISLRIKKK